MRLGILGRKVGMTQIFDENGYTVPVTVLDTAGCIVTQVKTKDKDGYSALQVAFGDRKPQNLRKTMAGHLKKSSAGSKALVKELRLSDADDLVGFTPGMKLSPGMFQKGDRVDVIGKSKGKGFQGVMKRHGFHGADASHGVHEYFRHGGSNGTNTFPGKVLKNKGMPGHTGFQKATSSNVEVFEVRPDENLLLIRGALPGPRSGVLMVRTAVKHPVTDKRNWSGDAAAPKEQAAS